MKKNLVKLSALFAMIFSISVETYGQEFQISEKDFETIYKNSLDYWNDKPHRIKRTLEIYSENSDKPQSKTNSMDEIIPPNQNYHVIDVESPARNYHNEKITIGEKTYTKLKDGQWREIVVATPNSTFPLAAKETIEKKAEIKKIGEEVFNNQKTIVYEKDEMEIYILRGYSDSDGTKIQSTEKQKYWIGSNGALLKTQSEDESLGGGAKVFSSRAMVTYEFDPNIRIEKPIK